MRITTQPDGGGGAGVEDAEWVADLLDAFHAGDIDVAVAELDVLVRKLRRAAKARRTLTCVSAGMLRQGLEFRASRRDSTP